MTKREVLVTLTAAVAIGGAIATATLHSALAEESAWKGVTLVYQTDVKGKIEPCG